MLACPWDGRCVWIYCESSACWRVPGTVAVCGSTVSLVHAGVSLGRSLCVHRRRNGGGGGKCMGYF